MDVGRGPGAAALAGGRRAGRRRGPRPHPLGRRPGRGAAPGRLRRTAFGHEDCTWSATPAAASVAKEPLASAPCRLIIEERLIAARPGPARQGAAGRGSAGKGGLRSPGAMRPLRARRLAPPAGAIGARLAEPPTALKAALSECLACAAARRPHEPGRHFAPRAERRTSRANPMGPASRTLEAEAPGNLDRPHRNPRPHRLRRGGQAPHRSSRPRAVRTRDASVRRLGPRAADAVAALASPPPVQMTKDLPGFLALLGGVRRNARPLSQAPLARRPAHRVADEDGVDASCRFWLHRPSTSGRP